MCCRDGLTQLSKSTDRHEPLLGHLIHIASEVARQGQPAMGLLYQYMQYIALCSLSTPFEYLRQVMPAMQRGVNRAFVQS